MVKKLYIPGPVEVSRDVLEAMVAPLVGHRTKEYAQVHHSVTAGLKTLLNTPGPVFLSTSSAFGIMEGAVRNLVQKRCATFGNGAFSSKWHDVVRRCGLEADLYSAEWGEPVTPEMVDEALATGRYDAMTMVHNETSTGVMSPLAEIAEVMKKYPDVSFIVDTVSSMSAVPLDLSLLQTDVCLAGVQKAFGLPPGLAVCAVSARALEKAKSTPIAATTSTSRSSPPTTPRTTRRAPPASASSSPSTTSFRRWRPKDWRTATPATGRWPRRPGRGSRSRGLPSSPPRAAAPRP